VGEVRRSCKQKEREGVDGAKLRKRTCNAKGEIESEFEYATYMSNAEMHGYSNGALGGMANAELSFRCRSPICNCILCA